MSAAGQTSGKIIVARNSALVSLALTILKLSVGIFTGSLALISEGIHGGIDLLATFATWLSVRVSDAPADEKHNYGHGKIESLSAFGQSILLTLTAIGIVAEAISRLVHRSTIEPPQHLSWAIVAIVVSMAVDTSRALALRAAARRYKSMALHADAAHFSTEIISSALVLVGLIMTREGSNRLAWADTAAAVGVACVMLYVAWHLANESADVLMDRAPEGLEADLQQIVRRVPGVRDVPRIRARVAGNRTFLDMTITVDPALAIEAGHAISSSVELALTEKIPSLDVLVHVEPADPTNDVADEIRSLAAGMRLQLHALRIREIHDRLYVTFHLELDPKITLAAAHAVVTSLEERIRQGIPRVAEIDSHLEPEDAHTP
jgi:cation diffusion facilitator family transporter